MRVFENTVTKEISVKSFIREEYDMSSKLIIHLKNTGGIKVNGVVEKVDYMMKKGDIIRLEMTEEKSDIKAVNIPVDIVYEDEDIVVINKPPLMPTHTSHGHQDDTLANALMYHFEKNNEYHTFRAVNRLDNDTSGLMIAAKNSYSHHKLSIQTQNNILKRRYMAVVCGDTKVSGVINLPIDRECDSIIKRTIKPSGKNALTYYRTIEKNNGYSLCEIELKTGRTHQIRVHFSHIGCPLAGDRMYGGLCTDIKRTALHSAYCEFIHPVTKEFMSFSKRPPEDIANIFNLPI